jgi:hypothetical protein
LRIQEWSRLELKERTITSSKDHDTLAAVSKPRPRSCTQERSKTRRDSEYFRVQLQPIKVPAHYAFLLITSEAP